MLSLLNTTFTNAVIKGFTLVGSLLSKLKSRSAYFENKNCTKATLQDLDDVNLLAKASIITTPTAYNDGSLNSVKGGEDADFDFQRGSAATRVNAQGLVENVQILSGNLVQNGDFSEISSELVTNGDFATDSDWTKQTSWSISGGSANYDFLSDSKYIRQTLLNGGFVAGKTYKINFEITSGTAYMNVNSNAGGLISINTYSVGSYSIYVTPSISASDLLFYGRNTSGTAFSIDNISVKELDPNDEWNTDSSCTIEIGEADFLSSTSNAPLYQSSTYFTIGKTYKITYTVSNYSSGRINWNDFGAGAGNGVNRIANGTYTEYYLKVGTSTNFGFQTNFGFTGSITDISVIEITHDTDLPRIDYTDGCGSLLLEPQGTNLVLTSASGTYGNSPASEANTTSPDGTNNAVIPTPDSSSDRYDYSVSGGAYATNTKLAYSWYRKRISTPPNTSFLGDLQFNVLVNVTQVGSTTQIQSDVNGFDRFQAIFNITDGSASSIIRAYFGNIVGVPGAVAYFGHQLEQSSYATSYIPTNGAAATRLADVCNNSGSSDLINSTEGVLYVETATLANDGTRQISISSGSNNDKIAIAYNTNGRLDVNVTSGGAYQVIFNYTGVVNPSIQNKIALKYKLNDFALWVNGVEVATDSSGITPVGLNVLNFSSASTSSQRFYGKTRAIAVFKEALSDDELEELTTV